jgi:hypothetical protein
MKLILKAGLLAVALTGVVGSPAQALIGGVVTNPGNKCLAGKIKCVIKKKACLLGCYKKATKLATAPDPACVTKCKDKFDGGASPAKGCFAKLEAKGGCLTTDDTRGIEAKIDGYVEEATAALGAPGTTATGKCLAQKINNLSGYDKCVLGVYAKGGQKALAADPAKLQKCIDKIVKGFTKADSKPPCATTDDVDEVRRADDLFIDDVLAELGGDLDTQRCSGDTAVTCTTAPGGVCVSGTCEHFFGAPLPLSAGGVATCVVSQWDGGISGTAAPDTGASAGTAGVLSRVYLAASTSQPCPKCVNDGLPNDGVAGGTCNGGTRDGDPCDSNGISPIPEFGATSHDCPPSGGTLVGTLPVDLSNTNDGTAAITLSASSPNCNAAPGKKCACGVCSLSTTTPCRDNGDCPGLGTCGFTAGSPAAPNACIDDTAVPGDGTLCSATGGGEGECTEGPIDQNCVIETFRGCITNADCPAAGDSCGSKNRECFLDNGTVGGQIAAVGTTTTPERHASRPTFASAFCIAPTGSAAVNNVAGLPGPGRLELGGVATEDGTDGVPGTCPTLFTFLPTSKGGVLDTGWTGISHDATVVSSGKVTVGVASCANPTPPCGVCTYAGPIANPNVN